ncbi:glycogen debranching protein GlgX [soil metagenome]
MGLFPKMHAVCLSHGTEPHYSDLPIATSCGHPLGATLTAQGVHFSVYSRTATALELCLYQSQDAARELACLSMERDDYDVWHAFVPDLQNGALYGYRAHGIWAPERGLWFNPHKLLLDPYAKAIQGDHVWQQEMQNIGADDLADAVDNGAQALKSVVIADEFDWQGIGHPRVAWKDTIIYEAHVKGLTKLQLEIPEQERGSYSALAHPATITYLKEIGVTSVQLMPVHQHLDDGFLIKRGLTNYWGYNTIGFFAVHSEYALSMNPQEQVAEFKTMVRELHRHGIEVILDVVYNHTAEGDENGPLIFLRGLDNPSYYLLNKDARVVNFTGCGNTVNSANPAALRLIMDSLRYWVEVMHVDGFRFDLGATLGRRGESFDIGAPFFQALVQDPVLNRVKLIAEPWDMGPNGYQIGGFPKPWHELNGRYRDKLRRFWHGNAAVTAAFAKRFCGSEDIFGPSGRSAHTSVNFITSHDGFPLRDLWTYNEKHNEANGEENRDGESNNEGWNCGVEGETVDAAIVATRHRIVRSCMASMFCSMGVPFITMGDERWRTQGGNNNAYCQDNEISWFDWSLNAEAGKMLHFVKQLAQFRRENPVLTRSQYFNGKIDPITARPDVLWVDASGEPLTHEKWNGMKLGFFATLIDGGTCEEGVVHVPLLFLFNGSNDDISFPMPGPGWRLKFDTSLEPCFTPEQQFVHTRKTYLSAAHSVACLLLKKA